MNKELLQRCLASAKGSIDVHGDVLYFEEPAIHDEVVYHKAQIAINTALTKDIEAELTKPAQEPISDSLLSHFATASTPKTETGALNYKIFAGLIEKHHGIGAK